MESSETAGQERQGEEPSQLPARREESRELARPREEATQQRLDWDGGGIDWEYLAQVVWRKKWWVLLTGAVGIVVGVVLARQTEAVYQTHASLWLESSDGENAGPIQGSDVLQGEGWSGLLTSLEILRPVARDYRLYLRTSRPVRETFFQDVDLLDDRPLRPGSYRLKVEGSEYTLSSEKDGVLETGRVGGTVGQSIGLRWNPPADALDAGTTVRFGLTSVSQAALSLGERLTVAYNPRSGGLMHARLTSGNPERGARLLNTVVDTFMATAYRLKSRKLREVSSILDEQTQYAAERLREAELALERFRVNTVTLPSDQPRATAGTVGSRSGQDPVFSEYFSLRLSASEIQSQVQVLEEKLEEARNGTLTAEELQLTPSVEGAAFLQTTVNRLVDLKAQRRALLQEYTEQHPDVQELDRQIESLRTETLPAQLEQVLAQLRSQLNNVQQREQSFASQLRQAPTRSIEEARLRRNVEIAEQLFKNLRSRQKEAELAASTAVPNVQVVDRAVPPSSPMSNQAPRIFLIASVAGFGLGIAGALIHDRIMDTTVRFPDQVTQDLGLSVIGVVPSLRRITTDDERSAEVMETFRALRGHLDRIEPRRGGVVMITSPSPQEGKSVITANLALAYAAQGQEVLFIDADTRRGNADELVNCSPSPGLTDYLEERVSLAEAVQETAVRGLSFMGHGGRLESFNRNLLDSRALIEMLRETERHFGLVILDTPPLSAGIDSLAIGENVDKVVVVLRAGASDREIARHHLDSLSRFGIRVAGVVLNDVSADTPFNQYRYYRYDSYRSAGELEGEIEFLPQTG